MKIVFQSKKPKAGAAVIVEGDEFVLAGAIKDFLDVVEKDKGAGVFGRSFGNSSIIFIL